MHVCASVCACGEGGRVGEEGDCVCVYRVWVVIMCVCARVYKILTMDVNMQEITSNFPFVST